MPKVIFSAFQPKTQMWIGFAGAAYFLAGAIMPLLQTPITMGDVFSVLNFLFGAAFLSYVGYSGYRRQHGAAVENPVNMDPRSRQKIDLVMIALANVTMAAVIIWRSRTGDISSTVAWISAGISFIVGNAAIIFGIRVRQRSAIPLRLTVFTVVCAILSANWSRAAASGIRAATASIFPKN